MKQTRTVLQRFRERFLPRPSTGCWIWTGYVARDRYGRLTLNVDGRSVPQLAHRLSWKLHIGPIPAGLFVCHRCDVYRCVNPDHLFLGTSADNQRDMAQKGRSSRGERHPFAKLTEAQVHGIRRELAAGVEGATLARKHGVGNMTVSLIRNRKVWAWLPEAGDDLYRANKELRGGAAQGGEG